MPKVKGSPKTGGRQKGTPNKVTANVREWLASLVDKNRRQMERDLKTLEPLQRLQMLEKLLPYVVPKQQAVTAEVGLNSLSDEQLDTIIAELTKDPEDNDNTGNISDGQAQEVGSFAMA